jgi:hypothetical protein
MGVVEPVAAGFGLELGEDDGLAFLDSPKSGTKPPSSRRKSKIKSAPEALY